MSLLINFVTNVLINFASAIQVICRTLPSLQSSWPYDELSVSLPVAVPFPRRKNLRGRVRLHVDYLLLAFKATVSRFFLQIKVANETSNIFNYLSAFLGFE